MLQFAIFCQNFEKIRLKTLLNPEIPRNCYAFLKNSQGPSPVDIELNEFNDVIFWVNFLSSNIFLKRISLVKFSKSKFLRSKVSRSKFSTSKFSSSKFSRSKFSISEFSGSIFAEIEKKWRSKNRFREIFNVKHFQVQIFAVNFRGEQISTLNKHKIAAKNSVFSPDNFQHIFIDCEPYKLGLINLGTNKQK